MRENNRIPWIAKLANVQVGKIFIVFGLIDELTSRKSQHYRLPGFVYRGFICMLRRDDKAMAVMGRYRARDFDARVQACRRLAPHLIYSFPIDAATVIGPTVPTALRFMQTSDGNTAIRLSDLTALYGLAAAESKLVVALLAVAAGFFRMLTLR